MIRKVSLLKLKDIFLIPNLITLSRLFASIYLFLNFSFITFSTSTLVVMIAIIGLSDSLDGIVARRLNQVSKLGTIYVLFSTKTITVSNFGKFGTVSIFFSICFFVINYTNELFIFIVFGGISLIFYYFVALEYLYRIIKDE